MEKQNDEIFCPECGKPVKRNAVICINCGVQVKELKVSPIQESAKPPVESYGPGKKSKGIAIVLAIFLGYWSWLYTYKKDFKKFWIYIGTIAIFVLLIIVIINLNPSSPDITQKPTGWSAILSNYGTWLWLLYLGSFIWPFCNSVVRSESFYRNYPNG